MIVYDNSLYNEHNSIQKFANRWFKPYEDRKVLDNGTYRLCQLDGTILRVPIARKWVKIFKKQSNSEPYITLCNTNTEEQADIDHEETKSEESGLKFR